MKVAEISSAVGFWTPSHFIRFFKQRMGSTPQAFRDAL
jgi:AraC-like DNA-binding protein